MVVQVEVSGSQGQVDHAQSLMMRAEQLKRDKERMLEKKVCMCVCVHACVHKIGVRIGALCE